MIEAAISAVSESVFRGEIYEDDTANPNTGEFLACHFHRKILRDAIKRTTRRIGVRAANQLGKTTILELIAKFLMKYYPADTLMWDMNEAKSDDHMKNRYMPILRSDPVLGPIFKRIAATPETRWDVCTTNILLPGMVFRARPLNEQWVQSFPAKYGFLHDAALVEAHYVRKIEVRFTKYESSYLWCVESQGDAPMGKDGGGFADFMGKTNEQKLWVRCPSCQTQVRFTFHHQRNDDTKIVAPLSVPSLDREAWIAHHRPILLSDERKHCGFKVEGELKHDDGSINEREIIKSTVYECPHCGGIWRDDNVYHSGDKVTYGPTRLYLDREAGLDDNWIATRPTALPGFQGYSLPRWINPRPSWGSVMLTFKHAMAAFNAGDTMPLQEFRTKWEGEDWDEKSANRVKFSPSFNSVDPTKQIENEAGRGMSVDCQKDKKVSAQNPESGKGGMTGHFWVVAHAWDKSGNQQQLWRGYCTSWQEWIAKAKELQISAYDIVIDGGFWLDEVINNAAAHAELMEEYDDSGRKTGRRAYVSWTVLTGDNYRSWKHEDGNYRDFSMPKNVVVPVDFSGNTYPVEVKIIRWSNHRFKDQLLTILQNTALKIPGKATMLALPLNAADPKDPTKFLLTDKTREMEVDTNQHQRTWESQMSANVRTMNPKSKQMEIVEVHPDPHLFDCCCGILYLMKRQGLLGAVAPEEMSAPEAT